MKFRKFLCYVLIFAIMMSLGVTAFAEDETGLQNSTITVYASELEGPNAITELLNIPGVDSVLVLYDDTQPSQELPIGSEISSAGSGLEFVGNNLVGPLAFGGSLYTEYIKNVRAGGKYYSNTLVGHAEGDPELTISLSHSVTLSTSLSASFGFSKGHISVKTGVDLSKSYTYQVGASFYINPTHNGKLVKSGILTATPVYTVTLFDVYRGIQGTTNESKIGTGTIKKPCGINYHKEYVYY